VAIICFGHSIRDSGDKLVSLKKNMKRKCLFVYFEKKIDIPTLIVEKSRHFSRHYFLNGH
jgi:hypothetical protein